MTNKNSIPILKLNNDKRLENGCKNKIKYSNYEEANIALKFAKIRLKYKHKGDRFIEMMSSYKCSFCNHFHIGHDISKPIALS